MRILHAVALFSLLATTLPAQEPLTIRVDAAGDDGPFPHFWAGTGMVSTAYSGNRFDKRWAENAIAIAGIPHEDTLFRCHNTYATTFIEGFDGTTMTLGFRRHDAWLDHVVTFCGLPQVYEFMEGPGAISKQSPWYTRGEAVELSKAIQWYDYRKQQTVKYATYAQVVRHCVERYGIKEVRRWWWQDDNEGYSPEQFEYVEAAVKGTDPTLIFGGDQRNDDFRKILARMKDVNPLTGKPFQIDFYSHHTKSTPVVVIKAMHGIIDWKEKNLPDTPDIIWANWECDREWDWHKDRPHRATAYYSAWKAAIVDAHRRSFLHGEKRRRIRLNFDDGFISSGWEDRCLFTIVDEQLVKRPISNVLTMLTLLGDRQLPISGLAGDSRIGVIATAHGTDQVALLLYHYDETDTAVGGDVRTVELTIANLPFRNARMAHWRLDGEHGDTWSLAKAGLAAAELVQRDELPLYRNQAPTAVGAGACTVAVPLPRQSVSLILIAEDPGAAPPAVPKLRAKSYLRTDGRHQLCLLWNDTSRSLRTYEVEAATVTGGPWQRVNDDSLWTTFSEPITADMPRFYRVRAIDLWDRPGPWTEPFTAPAPSSALWDQP